MIMSLSILKRNFLLVVTIGNGALAEPSEIFFEVAKALLKEDFWADRRIVVTGGGTREKIDEVRYISNFSSGKMAKVPLFITLSQRCRCLLHHDYG